jgi:ATP-dependent DNA helicase RecQ
MDAPLPDMTNETLHLEAPPPSRGLAPSRGLPPSRGLGVLPEIISRTWGIDQLRPLQEEAMQSVLDGRDLLLILPTGGGKSLCFQAPALVRAGLTVVVSPLISLMKDQVDGLRQNGVPAAMLTSIQSPAERRAVHEDLERGELQLLFVSPERLMMNGFIEGLVARGLEAVAIDEAHCISHWGHDFRPEYRQLGALKRIAGVPVHAFTATANERVRAEIVRDLNLTDPAVLVGPSDRPNLTYRTLPRRDLATQVLEVVHRHEGRAGIVYCISRKAVEKLDADLQAAGVRSAAYHAGLGANYRKRTQERFLNEEIDVVVATVAFGMGIDRTDVRFVVHAALPKGIEQYCQETGRAGRDALPAECVLFYSGSDYHSWKSLLERGHAEAVAEGGDSSPVALDAAIARLGGMMNFATRFLCRHRQLVEYFGESYAPPDAPAPNGTEASCGACDVCLGEIAAVEDSTVVAQKILSCVVRCEERYGAGHVTSVLRGGRAAGILRAGHDQLSTHGLLKEHSAADVRAWIEQLIGLDHLRTHGDLYPMLHVSPTGAGVLRGEKEVLLHALPAKPKATRRRRARPAADSLGPLAPGDEELFEQLRDLRRDLARERGVPPYVIFNDRTLAAMATLRPTDTAEFLTIKGIGEKKAKDLGPIFLERVASFATS